MRLALTLTLTLVYLFYSNCFITLRFGCCYFIWLAAFCISFSLVRWIVVVFNLSLAVSVGFIIAKEKRKKICDLHCSYTFCGYFFVMQCCYSVFCCCCCRVSCFAFAFALPSFVSFSLMSMRWTFFCMLIAQLLAGYYSLCRENWQPKMA